VHPQLPSEFLGNYFFADYCGGWIRRLTFTNGVAAHSFARGFYHPTDLKVSPDGSLYCLSRGDRPFRGESFVFRIFVPSAPSNFQWIRRLADGEIRLHASAQTGNLFNLETSIDLVHWTQVT